MLVVNKIDLVRPEHVDEIKAAYQSIIPAGDTILISATRGDNREDLLNKITDYIPEGEPFYPEDQVTDLYEREIAADLIREACLNHLRYEVPHGVVVRIDEFTERANGMAYIAATMFVERESQKGIVIGEGGKMLKRIGSAARAEIESMGGRKVFLELRVKVLKDWRDDEEWLKRFGYKIKKKR